MATLPHVRPRPPRWTVAALLAGILLPSLVVGGHSAALPASFYADAEARPNGAVALVGDSLTYAAWSDLPATFVRRKWGPFQLEARSGRKTTTTLATATSGLEAVRRIREGGFDPELWIIALGTNDARPTYGTPGAATAMIEAMMAEIGPGHDVIWIDVFLRDAEVQANAFNDALRAAARRHHRLTIADWQSVVADNPQWVVDDGVHLDLTGSRARNEFVARIALEPGCDGEPPVPPISAPAVVATASAAASAQRLCHRERHDRSTR